MIIWKPARKPESFSGNRPPHDRTQRKGAAWRKAPPLSLAGYSNDLSLKRPLERPLERIDQVELEPVEVGLGHTRGHSRTFDCVQQTAVQSSPVPQSKAGHRVAAHLIECVDV